MASVYTTQEVPGTRRDSFFDSLGRKFLLLCFLTIVMSLCALFVNSLADERAARSVEVLREISGHVGGPQSFLGPTLLIPYTAPPVPVVSNGATAAIALARRRGVYVVFPVSASAMVTSRTEERRRSLFRVPVFHADVQMQASFDLTGVPRALPSEAVLDWAGAEIVVGASDLRGALSDVTLTTATGVRTLATAVTMPNLLLGQEGTKQSLALLGTGIAGDAHPGATFDVTARLRFSGAQRIAVLPYGSSTRVEVHGDWPSPGFDGGALPATRNVAANGFDAAWSIPSIARGVRSEGDADAMTGLDKAAVGVSFIEVADPYQSVSRSLKYAPLFLGLVFLTYFVFEVTTGKRLHPAQYLLVGLAQLIFYLLLLSIAERIGFDFGFLLAGAASVALLAVNAGWVFQSSLQRLRAGAIFSVLYGMIYLLLRLEDNALIVGAIGSFVVLSAAMYLTRSLDWYGAGPKAFPSAATQMASPLPDRVGEL